jgi:hypothetical protein
MGSVSHPRETDPPLVVDSDTVLTRAIAFQFLQPVAGWRQQVFEIKCAIKHGQFALGDFPEAGEFFNVLSRKQEFRLLAPKASNHGLSLT